MTVAQVALIEAGAVGLGALLVKPASTRPMNARPRDLAECNE